MCLMEFMCWSIIQSRAQQDGKLRHQRFTDNAVASVSGFF